MIHDEKKLAQKACLALPPVPVRNNGNLRFDEPRKVIQTTVDFSSLGFPDDVKICISEAFWSHIGIRPARSVLTSWSYIKIYSRFLTDTECVKGIVDINSVMLVRYIEWLNRQTRENGRGWSKASMFAAYSTLRTLLQWIDRCKSGLLPKINYPSNPFPWRNRDSTPRSKMPPLQIRSIVKACEHEVAELRLKRQALSEQQKIAEQLDASGSRISKLEFPSGRALLPYYLLITIHAAGNPDAITALSRNCLHPIPLLSDREALVWFKARANSFQRRSFKVKDEYEPPALVKELLAWSKLLMPEAPLELQDRLFIYKTAQGVTALSTSAIKHLLKKFCHDNSLQLFSLSSIRPGVLSSFYRVSGDLRRVQAAANHKHLSTTIKYVETPEVTAQNQLRISELQEAYLQHIQEQTKGTRKIAAKPVVFDVVPTGNAVSMFGFDCSDPYSGIAPGSHKGELCESFMGCFACPNAVIKSDTLTVARLLQARDHLKSSKNQMDPARWQALYAGQLKILEEDILPKFSVKEIAAAELYLERLAPLLDLR